MKAARVYRDLGPKTRGFGTDQPKPTKCETLGGINVCRRHRGFGIEEHKNGGAS